MSPVIALVNVPVPVPSVVLLLAIVGLEVVLQQTPRAVTEAPPSAPTVPPLVAVVAVRSVTATVAERNGVLIGSSKKDIYGYLIEKCNPVVKNVPGKYIAEFMGIIPEWYSKMKRK